MGRRPAGAQTAALVGFYRLGIAAGTVLIPVRCFTCGNVVADRHAEYKERTGSGENAGKVLDELGITRYCCRRMLLTSVETIKQIIPFYEAIQRRHLEVQNELE